MHVTIADDHCAMSELASGIIIETIASKPDALLCLSSGETPRQTYASLQKAYEQNPDLFTAIRMIKLDEWCDIPLDEECTCESYLQKHLISPLHIDSSRYFTYGNQSAAVESECQTFNRFLEDYGPIDLIILGLGLNGHLGLIEPNLNLKQHAHVSRLSETTKKHAMLGKSTYKPDYGITLGIADIFNARRAVLLVAGRQKKNIVAKLLKGNISTQFPASLLWLHGNAELIIDRSLVEHAL